MDHTYTPSMFRKWWGDDPRMRIVHRLQFVDMADVFLVVFQARGGTGDYHCVFVTHGGETAVRRTFGAEWDESHVVVAYRIDRGGAHTEVLTVDVEHELAAYSLSGGAGSSGTVMAAELVTELPVEIERRALAARPKQAALSDDLFCQQLLDRQDRLAHTIYRQWRHLIYQDAATVQAATERMQSTLDQYEGHTSARGDYECFDLVRSDCRQLATVTRHLQNSISSDDVSQSL